MSKQKTAVIYYSLEGNTARLGESIAQAVEGDPYQIKPTKSIPTAGFNKYFLGGMQALFKRTPKLLPLEIDLSAYDLLIIGAPTWAGHVASPMRTWLVNNRLSGKRVAIFNTCLGDSKATLQDLQQLATGAKVIAKQTFVIEPKQPAAAERAAEQWAHGLTRAD